MLPREKKTKKNDRLLTIICRVLPPGREFADAFVTVTWNK